MYDVVKISDKTKKLKTCHDCGRQIHDYRIEFDGIETCINCLITARHESIALKQKGVWSKIWSVLTKNIELKTIATIIKQVKWRRYV